jgi:hypothetical protein
VSIPVVVLAIEAELSCVGVGGMDVRMMSLVIGDSGVVGIC